MIDWILTEFYLLGDFKGELQARAEQARAEQAQPIQ